MKYYSVNEYYKKTFGHKVYKLSLDAGCTCPNRDGTKGTGGCIFCSASGSGEFSADRNLSITEQIEKAKQLVQHKIKNENLSSSNYIAYFQNFTNTYGDENSLIQKYTEALKNPSIAGISIATRPDCLSQSILKKINELSKTEFPVPLKKQKKHFSIELGLQTSCQKSVEYINRRYQNEEYTDAVLRIKKLNPDIHIVTHIIFGLPGETEEDMLNSVKFAVNAGTDGIKIQVLNVLKGTRLEEEYLKTKFHIMQIDEYFELVKKTLKIIPPEIVIHRLTGDGAKRLLIEPKWVSDKKFVLNNFLNKILYSI
ncbi:TIGR01212 family radical SAM protein [Treponema sp.]|uniref:TIGR01212 family radical SAM protein n=1 Tax=Treponema sp. TaxID=166 RepID=UPI00298D8CC9|nr:TIGR01212 family radical SAM protein [Treponema sp.]